MFYELEVIGHVRIPPNLFEVKLKESVFEQLNKQFEDFTSNDLGFIINIAEILEIGDGVIIPGDGAAYYETKFKVIIFKPEIQEVILGKISDITDFGAFIEIGPIDGMIHISQTMDDFVSFNKTGTLNGKESKRNLKIGDKCRARIIAVSYKDINSPKIGLTMRQPSLGALAWLDKKEEKVKEEKKVKGRK